ncbi:hypothetical protein [Dictyobacter aurantiacus]|uniref:Membrane protein NfeD2 N-terminal transmembrane domain-containing protein n=1 Tax=Dictyobacter aurantiacus TaxID=1936993 RepID=A0A401ZHA4_9CHLR|nr:hypothetical protein [Dictyobacter aurantiacus]GCE06265.1 hypothetical protein KDAU_35940 [Dictyobacter aurantiacus]
MIATDQLSLLFIGCFLIGILYLLVTALFGNLGHHGQDGGGHAHHFHIEGHSPAGHNGAHQPHHANSGEGHFSLFSIINPTSIVLFLIGFGFFGYALHTNTNLGMAIILGIACVSGIIVAALFLTMFSRMLGGSEAATVQDVADRTGLLGKVSLTIQENGLGEILYISPGGMRKSIPARSIDNRRLERDQEVVVVNYQHGIAEVDTWDHFVNQEDSASLLQSEDDDMATLRALLEEPNKNDSEYIMRNDTKKE